MPWQTIIIGWGSTSDSQFPVMPNNLQVFLLVVFCIFFLSGVYVFVCLWCRPTLSDEFQPESLYFEFTSFPVRWDANCCSARLPRRLLWGLFHWFCILYFVFLRCVLLFLSSVFCNLHFWFCIYTVVLKGEQRWWRHDLCWRCWGRCSHILTWVLTLLMVALVLVIMVTVVESIKNENPLFSSIRQRHCKSRG